MEVFQLAERFGCLDYFLASTHRFHQIIGEYEGVKLAVDTVRVGPFDKQDRFPGKTVYPRQSSMPLPFDRAAVSFYLRFLPFQFLIHISSFLQKTMPNRIILAEKRRRSACSSIVFRHPGVPPNRLKIQRRLKKFLENP